MKSLLIQLDDSTYRALEHIAPSRKRVRAEFIRKAIRQAVREAEESAMKQAYLSQPDSESEADDWSNAEEFKH